ncbi:MAG: hypothetical protein VXW65_12250 [Pseudomonadota bacterium]|nr:hypothetical protein [Pseudomonadota bacterium]
MRFLWGLLLILAVLGGIGWWWFGWAASNPNAANDAAVALAPLPNDAVLDVVQHVPVTTSVVSLGAEDQLAQDQQRVDTLRQHMHHYASCIENNPCGLPDSDPKAVFFTVSQTLAASLRELALIGARQPELMAATAALAREYLLFPEGYVQEAALQIFAQLPPDPDNAARIRQLLAESFNDGIVAQSLLELQRYPDTAAIAQLTPVLLQGLRSGGFHAADQIARDIAPFLNRDNIGQYEQLLQQMPEALERHRRLSDAIAQWHQQQASRSH